MPITYNGRGPASFSAHVTGDTSAFSVTPATGEIEDGKAVLLTVTFVPRELVTQTAVLEVRQLPLGSVHKSLGTFGATCIGTL
jgi:hypothetical protein